jgi:hypothetical protein
MYINAWMGRWRRIWEAHISSGEHQYQYHNLSKMHQNKQTNRMGLTSITRKEGSQYVNLREKKKKREKRKKREREGKKRKILSAQKEKEKNPPRKR